MDRIEIADRLAACEASFRRAQQGNCPVRYATSLAALREAEARAAEVLQAEPRITSEAA